MQSRAHEDSTGGEANAGEDGVMAKVEKLRETDEGERYRENKHRRAEQSPDVAEQSSDVADQALCPQWVVCRKQLFTVTA